MHAYMNILNLHMLDQDPSIFMHAYIIYILFMLDFVQLRALEKSLRKKKKKDAEAAADMEE